LPASVVEALYDLLDPESSRNPFTRAKTRWRIYIAFVLMLHQGLRRGELLLLTADCVKSGFDKKRQTPRYWLNVQDNEYEDGEADETIDSRYSKPSIKTVHSVRQIPVSGLTAQLVQTYVENYRGRPSHPFLLNSYLGNPLATESLTKAFREVSNVLPEPVRRELSDRCGKDSVMPHDLRHYVPFLTISGNLEGLLEHLGSVGWAVNVLGQSPDIVSRSYKLFRKSRSWSAGR